MNDQPTVQSVIVKLEQVIARWNDLTESRIRGTLRVVQGSKRERDELVDGEGFGSIPAPIHLDVLDAMSSILMWADLLHEDVAQVIGHDRLPSAASAYEDPYRFLAYTVELLPEACEMRPDFIEHADERAERMRSLLLAKLGELYDGQTLEAVCPFCVGRTFRKLFGALTMRVRIQPSRTREGETEVFVVCENPDGCTPFSSEVDLWIKDRPAWPMSRWPWLSDRLIPAARVGVA